MKFFATPDHTLVERDRKTNKIKNIYKFDKKGEFITDDVKLIDKLKMHFKFEEKKIYQCKHCEFTTDSRGLLGSHYKNLHPTNKDE